ncbi:MAG TPA: nucleotidyltransferase family protein, partial [Sphingomonas sp.]
MTPALALVGALRDPGATASFDAARWQAVITVARAELLIGTLADRLDGLPVPGAVRAILYDARVAAEQGRIAALWEAEMVRRALKPIGCSVVLLKGTAFVAAGLAAGRGRSVGDTDILVPREALPDVERALLGAGWEWVKPDPYDDAYYRRWMHELPPLIHRERDRIVDVHHTILPLTARPKPDAAVMIAEAEPLGNGLSVLSRPAMIVHAAAHLIADGDLSGGLRNLWDIDQLCREAEEGDPDFYLALAEESWSNGLSDEIARALRLAAQIFGTPVKAYDEPIRTRNEEKHSDRWFRDRLLARDGWGRGTRPATRFGFYLRGHALRMPPAMLARHLWIK